MWLLSSMLIVCYNTVDQKRMWFVTLCWDIIETFGDVQTVFDVIDINMIFDLVRFMKHYL